MGKSKRHHYNPRYYLKNFENSKGYLWRFEKLSEQIVLGDNNSFGVKKHWNTLKNPPEGVAPDWAENRISQVDYYASLVVSKIVSGQFPSDIQPLALAISLMENHQPRLKKELQTTESIKVQDWTDDYFLCVSLSAALREWKNYLPDSYTVLIIPQESDLRFLTSSNPLISIDNKPDMFFPVSSKHCLFMDFKAGSLKKSPSRMRPDENLVADINGMIIANSWEYVYSMRADFLLK
jgi:Protein of unknown function (DUF4238)